MDDPTARLPLWLVANPSSGSNSPESLAALQQALGEAGCAPARTILCPDDTLPTRADLEAAGVATLAIYTGDGTINATAKGIEGWQGHVLVLPGGTQNLLAKSLHGDVDPATIVQRLAAGTLAPRRRSAVKTSQGHALVEVVAGPGATWADVREGLRAPGIATLATALGEAVRETASGALVHVAEPLMGRPEGYRALRVDADSGTLNIDGYDASDWKELAAHATNMIVRRDFRDGPHQHVGTAPRLTCRSDEPIALMLDGERCDGGPQETFECVIFAVEFLHSPPQS
ncbi:diacylglycerol/lipid kinase family protein [Novosphingobium cyanobacteriorum]|uniref:Diacylglycerol kinase family protein n=1 Tax=Novosphingobium cyanobacteriorum TaxID=3024215 RepID=A0ABT6CI08_9SPHN|nr:diacylglycerol kinase family protein [Novosphingobium cyanobacteriorum]MDF8333560.1 diacylglycerol kinase family protein [Novosphingobium cyanobacteriorum]